MPIHPSSTSSSDEFDSAAHPVRSLWRRPLILFVAIVFVASFVGVVFARFIRFDSLCHRALECVLIGKKETQPFRSNAVYRFDRVCGDLPHLANRPDLCVYRSEHFVTDTHGYRNEGSIPDSNYKLALFGDSFAYGQGNTQDQTPAAELSRALGSPVYDGAGKTELRFLRQVVENLASLERVYYFHLERHPREPRELEDYIRGFDSKDRAAYRRWYRQWKIYDPVQILATRLDKWTRRKGLFPNFYADTIEILPTANSGEHVFLKSYAHLVAADTARIDREKAFFKGLRDLLRERRIELSVVLIPEKYSVYFPAGSGTYLGALENILRSQGLSVVNLLPDFIQAARAPSELEDPLYWRDDTHWAPRGIRLMARKTANRD